MNEVIEFLTVLAKELERAEPNPATGLIEMTPEVVKELVGELKRLADTLNK